MINSLLGPLQKAKIGTWNQIGNLGGQSLLFGLLVLLEARVNHGVLGVMTTLLIAAPLVALISLRARPHVPTRRGRMESLRSVSRELRFVLLRRAAIPSLLLLLLPVGTGAIASVLIGMSDQYGASPVQLAFANGWGGAVFTMAGCGAALLFPARWNRMVPYALAAAVYGVTSLGIWAAPL